MILFRSLGAAAALVLLAAAPAAQTDACRDALAEAEARYVQGAFDSVEAVLTPCLDDADTPVAAFRVLALARLRQGDITGAKLTLLRILAVEPGYEPDPVLDPPDYVALIRVVRGQVGAAPAPPGEQAPSEAAPADSVVAPRLALPPAARRPAVALPQDEDADGVEPAARPEAPRLAEPRPAEPEAPAEPSEAVAPEAGGATLGYRLWVGIGSYGGERRGIGTSAFETFMKNSGPIFGIGFTADVASQLRVFADVETAYYSTIDTPWEEALFNSRIFGDSSDIDSWVRTATVGAHLRLRPAGVTPYLLVGGGIATGGSGGFQVAALGTAGAGLEVPLFDFVGVYLEGSGTVTAPARALDEAGGPDARGDVFSGARFGLRYTVGG